MAKILRANGDREDIAYKGPNDTLSLAQLQKAVGGYIEQVRVPNCHNILMVNEEGKLQGLPFNHQASILAQQVIAGDVVLCVITELETE